VVSPETRALTIVIDRQPEIDYLAIDLHAYFVEVWA
jgi:hypothetical protein